jgi:hypothetical protein
MLLTDVIEFRNVAENLDHLSRFLKNAPPLDRFPDSGQSALSSAHVYIDPRFVEFARETLSDSRGQSEGFFGDQIDL